MHANFDRELAAYFTDVEHLREWFARWLTAKELPKRLLVIYGVGGVGKSSLLRMFRLHCKAQRVPVALASGDEEKSAVDVLARWAEDLRAGAVRLPAFDKTFSHYRALQAKVTEEAQKSRDKLAGLAGKAASKTAESVAGALAGAALGSMIPGIGTVVGALGGLGAEALVEWLRGFLRQPDIDLLLDPTKKLTEDFLTDLDKAAAKQRIVLMLDTFEQMSGLEDWTREVAQYLTGNVENVLLVIAGRVVPNWGGAWPTWMAYAEVEELKPMSEEDMREVARRYYAAIRGGEPDPKQVEAIVRFARGLPMVVTGAVQLWVQYGLENFQAVKAEVVADLVDRLMEGVPKELKPAVEAAAIVRWFDQPVLRAVLKQDDVRDVYNELRRFPFVRARAEGLTLHDAVREMIEENLKVHDREHHRELHERAAAYFEVRLEKAKGEEAERLKLEVLYHRIRADEQAGIMLFQEMAEELAQYGFVNHLRILLNDVSTYPLEEQNSRLWKEYYDALLAKLESRAEEAEKNLYRIGNHHAAEPRLKGYALCDWATIRTRTRFILQPGGLEALIQAIERSNSFLPDSDSKKITNLINLGEAFRRVWEYDKSEDNFNKALNIYRKRSDKLGMAIVFRSLLDLNAIRGNWKQMFHARSHAIDNLPEFSKNSLLFGDIIGRWAVALCWAGRFKEAEYNARSSLNIRRQVGDLEVMGPLRDLGFALGMQDRFDEAYQVFGQSLEVYRNWASLQGSHIQLIAQEDDGTLCYWGVVSLRQGIYSQAEGRLIKSLLIREEKNPLGIPESVCFLGELYESVGNFVRAARYYQRRLDFRLTGRWYFDSKALVGLIRVKHALQEYETIPPLLTEAEEAAQRYEYNDHLASLRLTQGHIAWDGHIPEWGSGFDAALHYYQQALIYALRYNRFLLDEVLSGRPQGTPLRPIIPECLKRGEEGRRMLIALRDWWQTGMNDVGTPRPDTISPIPEGIPLLEAERIAREREPGDGSPQKSVVEQIDGALKEMGAA